MLQLAVTPHMEVANKVVFVSSSLWHWVRTTSVQTNLRGSQAPAPSHTGRCTSYEGLDRGCADFPLIRQMSPAAPPWCCLRVKMRRTHVEHNESGLPTKADSDSSIADVAEGPRLCKNSYI